MVDNECVNTSNDLAYAITPAVTDNYCSIEYQLTEFDCYKENDLESILSNTTVSTPNMRVPKTLEELLQ